MSKPPHRCFRIANSASRSASTCRTSASRSAAAFPIAATADYRELGLPDNDVRWGADLTLYPGSPREIRLLAVHLKASCNRDPLTSSRPDCQLLQQQVPILEDWIDLRAKNDDAFAVIGDFNRRFDRERDLARDAHGRIAAMWPEIDDGEPAGADLTDAGIDHGAVNCGHGASMPIDHLVLGRKLARRMVPRLVSGLGLSGRRPALARSLRVVGRTRPGGLHDL